MGQVQIVGLCASHDQAVEVAFKRQRCAITASDVERIVAVVASALVGCGLGYLIAVDAQNYRITGYVANPSYDIGNWRNVNSVTRPCDAL